MPYIDRDPSTGEVFFIDYDGKRYVIADSPSGSPGEQPTSVRVYTASVVFADFNDWGGQIGSVPLGITLPAGTLVLGCKAVVTQEFLTPTGDATAALTDTIDDPGFNGTWGLSITTDFDILGTYFGPGIQGNLVEAEIALRIEDSVDFGVFTQGAATLTIFTLQA
jgi:hypothetical protein